MDTKKKAFAIAALRRSSYRWPGRWQAEKLSKVGRNQYVCAMCPPGTIHPKKNTQMDHIVPIVDPEKGFTNFDDYIDRLFVYEDEFQRLCLSHHQEKTAKENSTRKETKRKAKKKVIKKKTVKKRTIRKK